MNPPELLGPFWYKLQATCWCLHTCHFYNLPWQFNTMPDGSTKKSLQFSDGFPYFPLPLGVTKSNLTGVIACPGVMSPTNEGHSLETLFQADWKDASNSKDGNYLAGMTPPMLLENGKLFGMLKLLGLESNFLSSFEYEIVDFHKL